MNASRKTGSSPAAALAASVAAGGLGAAYYYYSNQNRGMTQIVAPSKAKSVVTEDVAKKQSAKFQALAAIEFQQERKRIELARFLHDIQVMAQEAQQQSIVKRYTKRSQQWNLQESAKEAGIVTFSAQEQADLTKVFRGPSHKNQQAVWKWIDRIVARAGVAPETDKRSMDGSSLLALIQAVTNQLKQEATVVNLQNQGFDHVVVVGDMHGSLPCCQQVLNLIKDDLIKTENTAVIINGDFIDRGTHSVEVLAILAMLKLTFPHRLFLLRGNHEDEMVASAYGFTDELHSKYGQAATQEKLWNPLTEFMAALPLAALTDTACVLHGGLPKDNFQLEELSRIALEERLKLKTTIARRTKLEELIETVLWSDPSPNPGVTASPRGGGIAFGPDVALRFLEAHNLKYLIRSHEPVERGIQVLPCGMNSDQDNRAVLTVFSSALYPNGEAFNLGAIVRLDNHGDQMWEATTFTHPSPLSLDAVMESASSAMQTLLRRGSRLLHAATSSSQQQDDAVQETLRSYIAGNRVKLQRYFESVQDTSTGTITVDQWTTAMQEHLGLDQVPWEELQATLAPTVEGKSNAIDWKAFLAGGTAKAHQVVADLPGQDSDRLTDLFAFMDTDDSGEIGLEEFLAGIDVLNVKHLPAGQQITNGAELFAKLDADGNGSINAQEFGKILQHSSKLRNLVNQLPAEDLQNLQEHHALLKAAFEFLDVDGNGHVDRQEFRQGVGLLNKRLPKESKIANPDELFSLMDLDGSGQIDISEFSRIFQSL